MSLASRKDFRPLSFGKESGLTLIEIIITVAIIGLIMGLSTAVFRNSFDAQLSDTASKLAGTIKYVYNEAAIKNQYYRLVIDMGGQTFAVESSSEPFKISASQEGTAEISPASTSDSPPQVPADNSENADTQLKAPPVSTGFEGVSSYLLKPIKLPENVKIKDVYVAHLDKKIDSGKTAIYFFPNGWVEKAIINLSDEKGETFYSIETHSSSGRTTIKDEYLDYKPEDEKP